MVKILSGWSNYGGSTTSFINLCNLFNKKGVECAFYGPHEYHKSKCNGFHLSELKLDRNDVVIYHFLNILKKRPPVRRLVLSLHEKELYNLKDKPYEIFDTIHYLNDIQREWHGVVHPYFIAPNAHEKLIVNDMQPTKQAGVIGSIDENKQTHVSIQRALDDGMQHVHLFGNITDVQYFQDFVYPLMQQYKDTIEMHEYVEDKQKMYDILSDVYLSSKSENASLVADECTMTNVKFHGNKQTEIDQPLISNDDVFEIWKTQVL